MKLKVFISYSTKDIETAHEAYDLLRNEGCDPYLAEYTAKPGCKLNAELEDKIKKSDVFILFWSKSAKKSAWVPQEIGIAKGAGKTILPVVLDHTPLPGFIEGLKYIDLTKIPAEGLKQVSSFAQEKNMEIRYQAQQKSDMVKGVVFLGLVAVLIIGLSEK